MGSLLPLQSQNLFPVENAEKLSAMNVSGAFRYQFFAAEALCILISNIFWLNPLKLFFLRFKEQVFFNLKIKYQRFNVKYSPMD